jgi:tRNA wybutosine-synthesizing protein 3
MSFKQDKKRYLDALYEPDKSRKGDVDARISTLIDLMNEKKDYVTTSSCSGRIMLLGKSFETKKRDCKWLLSSHDPVTAEQMWDCIVENQTESPLLFKIEAPIIHVQCRTLDAAKDLMKQAQEVGFKHSGIFVIKEERVMVHILFPNSFEFPVADKELLVTQEFITYAVEMANKKLSLGHAKLEALLALLRQK